MKKKFLIISSLLLLFLIFLFSFLRLQNKVCYKILGVVEADKFYLDLNFNNKIDSNELLKLKNINAFYPIKNDFSIQKSKEFELSVDEYIKLGIIARKFASELLQDKFVEVISLSSDRVEIKIGSLNYEKVLLQNGLAFLKDDSKNLSLAQSFSFSQIKNNLEEISKLDYFVLNFNTNTLHKNNCEHVKNIKNYKIIFKNELKNKNYFSCKKCLDFSDNIAKYSLPLNKNKYENDVYKKNDNIELFIMNPLNKKKLNFNCNTKLCSKLVQEINSSKNSIDVALFSIDNQNEIITALKNAKTRGVNVRCVLEYNENNSNLNPYINQFAQEFGCVMNNASNLMHNKFLIFDDKKVFTGSTNLTFSGLSGYNSNASVLIEDSNLAEFYKKEFEQLYLSKFSNHKNDIGIFKTKIANTNIKAGFSPKSDIYAEIILPLIKNAKSEILISAFYLTDDRLIDELISSKKRGVKVFIIIDALSSMNFKNKISKLRENGVVTAIENWGGKNHEKTILVDSYSLLLGSMNFSKSGFVKNDENVILIKNSILASLYRDYYLFLINSFDKKYFHTFVRAESFESINSCFDGIDNNFDGKIDSLDEACKLKK